MMHESMEITDRLYGRLANDDIKSTISNLSVRKESQADEEIFRDVLDCMSSKHLGQKPPSVMETFQPS